MAQKLDAPKVFLFSAGGPGARERMDRSVQRGFAPILSRAFGFDFDAAGASHPEGRLRAWGARPSQRNMTRLEMLAPGDLGIGYAEGEFAYVARFADNLHSPALARQLWGDRGPDMEALIYLFDEVERLDLDREQVLDALGYSHLFVPRGLVVPTAEHQPDAAAEMSSAGDLAEWLTSAEGRIARARKTEAKPSTETRPRTVEESLGDGFNAPRDAGSAVGGGGPPGKRRRIDTIPEPEPLPDAYASIEAPPAVRPGEEFEIVVGLADRPQLGTGGSGVIPRPEGLSEYTLTIQLVTSAFELRPGESPRVELSVSSEQPFPTVAMRLTAKQSEAEAGLLKVLYSVGAETVGFAVRAVAIVRDGQPAEAFEPPQEPNIPFSVPPGTDVPDITVRVLNDDSPGYLQWTMETPWTDLDTPAEPALIRIGTKPEEFVRQIIDGVSRRKSKADLPDYINGQAKVVGEKVPKELWSLLRACAERRRAQASKGDAEGERSLRPQVLILTEDPYVPWEMAQMDSPLIEDGDLPQLAAQATVGRWIFGPQNEPPPPRASACSVTQMAVVSGNYEPPLTEASAEASGLVKDFSAQPVEAMLEPLIAFLRDVGLSNLLHFAMHGRYRPGTAENGLFLADGEVLEPTSVRGVELASGPFVFLNVCQVGAGEELLGDYAGMSGAFVHAGASGVVAPLWSIADKSARAIAERFYAQSREAEGISPAEYFRQQRAGAAGADLRTCIAYQFHGHPSMRVSA